MAALAANQSISPETIKKAFKNKDNFFADGTFDWLKFLEKDESGQQERDRHVLLKEFVDAIDDKHRDPKVDWDYIEGLVNAK